MFHNYEIGYGGLYSYSFINEKQHFDHRSSSYYVRIKSRPFELYVDFKLHVYNAMYNGYNNSNLDLNNYICMNNKQNEI